MMRGDVVLVSGKGDYGKSRPAVVVQSSYLMDHLESVTVAPLTSDILKNVSIRVAIEPTEGNGLRARSDIMVDKIQTYPRPKVFGTIGKISDDEIGGLDTALAYFFQLGQVLIRPTAGNK
jgi:mRNA interferase MazF